MTGKQPDSETDLQFDIAEVLGRLQSSSHRLEAVMCLTEAVKNRLYKLAKDIDTAAGTKLSTVPEVQTLDEIKAYLFGDHEDADVSKIRTVLKFDQKAANWLRHWLSKQLIQCDSTASVKAFLDLHATKIAKEQEVVNVFDLLYYVGRTSEETANLLGMSPDKVESLHGKLLAKYPDLSSTDDSARSLAAIPRHPPIGTYKIPARKFGRAAILGGLLTVMLVVGLFVLPLFSNKDASRLSEHQPGDEIAVFIGNPAVKMTFCWVPAGEFEMGVGGVGNDEDNPRKVIISRGFWMGQTEVTQLQWKATGVKIAGDRDPTLPNNNDIKGDDLPVVGISQDQAKQFCESMGGLTGRLVRLPTEAEWEYACRAGASTRFPHGDDEINLKNFGWYAKNSGNKPNIVGLLKPNAWGLKDMHGNVSEWCADYYSPYSRLKNERDPVQIFPEYREFAVARGGSYRSEAETCTAMTRIKRKRVERGYFFGFRVCFSE